MISVAGFRDSFPQFTEALFPDGRVAFYLSLAGKAMSEEKWEDLYEEGVCLYAAHHLTLEAAAMKAADGTGGMDAAAGPVTSQTKTVGSVSSPKPGRRGRVRKRQRKRRTLERHRLRQTVVGSSP